MVSLQLKKIFGAKLQIQYNGTGYLLKVEDPNVVIEAVICEAFAGQLWPEK